MRGNITTRGICNTLIAIQIQVDRLVIKSQSIPDAAVRAKNRGILHHQPRAVDRKIDDRIDPVVNHFRRHIEEVARVGRRCGHAINGETRIGSGRIAFNPDPGGTGRFRFRLHIREKDLKISGRLTNFDIPSQDSYCGNGDGGNHNHQRHDGQQFNEGQASRCFHESHSPPA